MKKRSGILLVNLGTPDSPKVTDVKKYLTEFLTDDRVIDFPWLKRQLLVRGLIIPLRAKKSAKSYKAVWTERGSPLLFHSQDTAEALSKQLGEDFVVELAMRYQSPSIEKGLNALRDQNVSEIIILPLFPQYASASTGSVHQEVMRVLSNWNEIPKLHFINSYPTNAKMIQAYAAQSAGMDINGYDHILLSFHGLPKRQLKKADRNNVCLKSGCCDELDEKNQFCYSAQTYATARALAKELNLDESRYTVCFQSRLGKDPWQEPYTSSVLDKLAKKGAKKILVFCPAFVADCLETTFEISEENAEEFIKAGGETVDLVPSLNSHPLWIDALQELVLSSSSSGLSQLLFSSER